MISFSDIEFQRTKLLIKGKVKSEPISEELKNWISDTFGVSVLNVIFDNIVSDERPRIQVIVEHQEEVKVFGDESTYGFCGKKTSLIISKLAEILQFKKSNLNIENSFVVFSAFAPLAKQEAFSKIAKSKFKQLKNKLNNPAIWEIPYQLGYPAIFVYTNDQLESEDIETNKKYYINEFFNLLKPYDEFNYIDLDKFSVGFDSKENFDRVYGGSWFHYWHG